MDKLSKKLKILTDEIKDHGLYKSERILSSKQSSEIKVNNKSVLNFCANNYLGLSNNKQLIEYGKEALEKFGFGLSSVRFICGTQSIHKELENRISDFFDLQQQLKLAIDAVMADPIYLDNKYPCTLHVDTPHPAQSPISGWWRFQMMSS